MLNLDLNLWYLDDGTVAGEPEVVLKALNIITDKAHEIGLELNYQKCKISVLCTYTHDSKISIIQNFRNMFPGIKEMEQENAFLLGSPLTDQSDIVCLDRKIDDLKRSSENMKNISAHSAFYLLQISISTPRLIFLPCLAFYHQFKKFPIWWTSCYPNLTDSMIQHC